MISANQACETFDQLIEETAASIGNGSTLYNIDPFPS